MPDRREGKVVQVLGGYAPTEVVVNLGAEDGVTEKTEFLVYQKGDELKDPDTGESLAAVEIVRGRGQPKHIQPRLTTIHQIRKTRRKIVETMFAQTREIEAEEITPFAHGTAVGDLVRVVRS